MGKMILKLKNGKTKEYEGDTEGLRRAWVLCVGIYHYLPFKDGKIQLEEIEKCEIIETK